MFYKTSRYYKIATTTVKTRAGQMVKAVKLRILPDTEGKSTMIKASDRLDVIAQSQYKNATKFWHIADANTELEANQLLEVGRKINIPET